MREPQERQERVEVEKSRGRAQQVITSQASIRLIGACVLSLALLCFGFYVLLDSGRSAELQKIAAGWIGVVIGYWLK